MNEQLKYLLQGLNPIRLGIAVGFFFHHTATQDIVFYPAEDPVFNQVDFFVRLGMN
jgi:hypothetical protein